MRVKGLVWLGTRTDRFEEMRDFLFELTGVAPRIDEPDGQVYELTSGRPPATRAEPSSRGRRPPIVEA